MIINYTFIIFMIYQVYREKKNYMKKILHDGKLKK